MDSIKSEKSGSFDIATYRINQSYGETLGSKKLVSNVAVGKPIKGRFFRSSTADENSIDVFVYEDKIDNIFYLVSPMVAEVLDSSTRAVTLHLAIDRANNPFLIPVPLPDTNGQRNPWPQSLLAAIEHAREKWVRIDSDKSAGIYQLYVAQGVLEEPKWPDLSLDELVNIAFSGRVISDLDHPKVQAAQGRI
jgi:hypothetical protein